MPLDVTTDPIEITAVLERAVDGDPVGGTLLGTIAATLGSGAWCARSATALAARSDVAYPVVVSPGWLDADLPDLLAALASVPGLAGVSGPPREAELIASAFADRRPGLTVQRTDMLLFRLDELTEPDGVPGQARPATVEDRSQLVDWYRAFELEAHGSTHDQEPRVDRVLAEGRAWLWTLGDEPVSLAARRPAVAGSARIAPVYTPREHRENGYGSAVTAVATRDVLDEGAVPVLFTDLANPTPNDIYQRLGYRKVEDRTEFRFG